jgi:Peptidase family M28
MGDAYDEGFVLGVVRELSERIGPRLGGSEASHRARDYLSELLGGMGLEVRLQPFTYLGWEYERMPAMHLMAPVAEELASQPMAFTLATGGPIEGKVWRDGIVPAIPGVFEFTRLAVGEGGERRAAIFVPPQDGPAFPLPSLDLMFTEPGLYIPKADGDRILAWLDEGKEVRVRLETFGRHAPGFIDSNVIARLSGELDERIVVSSHYDTAWKAPGAVDNASGVAAMTEVARRVTERGARHTFEFIAFAAEEWFLFGSEFFVAEASYRGEIDLYKGVVNCDPLGPGNTLSVWVGPDFLRGLADQVVQDLGVFDRYEVAFTDPHTGSDHYPFWTRGVPACFPIFVPVPAEYHQPADTMAIVDPDKIRTIVDVVDGVAQALDRQPAT